MSNFTGPAINPNTGKVEEAHFLDDYFGRRKYGVLFPSDDTIWPEAKISRPRDNFAGALSEPVTMTQRREIGLFKTHRGWVTVSSILNDDGTISVETEGGDIIATVGDKEHRVEPGSPFVVYRYGETSRCPHYAGCTPDKCSRCWEHDPSA